MTNPRKSVTRAKEMKMSQKVENTVRISVPSHLVAKVRTYLKQEGIGRYVKVFSSDDINVPVQLRYAYSAETQEYIVTGRRLLLNSEHIAARHIADIASSELSEIRRIKCFSAAQKLIILTKTRKSALKCI